MRVGMGWGVIGRVGRDSSIRYYHERRRRIPALALVVVSIKEEVVQEMGNSARGLNGGSWDGGFGIRGEGG